MSFVVIDSVEGVIAFSKELVLQNSKDYNRLAIKDKFSLAF